MLLISFAHAQLTCIFRYFDIKSLEILNYLT